MAKKRARIDLLKVELELIDFESAKITPHMELFILHYTGIGQETFGNATKAYMKAYGYPAKATPARYNVARMAGARLIAKDSIKKRIAEILSSYHRNEMVDQERAFVAMQRGNLQAKIMAIKTYDELKGRITRKLKLSGGVKTDLNDEQMAAMAGVVQKKIGAKVEKKKRK